MTAEPFFFDAQSEADTERLGQALAAALCADDQGGVVALDGPLGAGKTRLVQAVAAACGVDRREAVSPTFVLVHEYHGRVTIYHLDAYRLRDEDEFLQLGVDEQFVPPNLAFIEWADRIASCLPEDRVGIRIHIQDGTGRRFEITGQGEHAARAVARLRESLSG